MLDFAAIRFGTIRVTCGGRRADDRTEWKDQRTSILLNAPWIEDLEPLILSIHLSCEYSGVSTYGKLKKATVHFSFELQRAK